MTTDSCSGEGKWRRSNLTTSALSRPLLALTVWIGQWCASKLEQYHSGRVPCRPGGVVDATSTAAPMHGAPTFGTKHCLSCKKHHNNRVHMLPSLVRVETPPTINMHNGVEVDRRLPKFQQESRAPVVLSESLSSGPVMEDAFTVHKFYDSCF
jgi:hypothetical protein